MRKIIITTLLLCLSFPILAVANDAGASSTNSPCHIKVAWHDYQPYSYLHKQSGRLLGDDITLVRSVLNAMQCEVHFVNLSFARAMKALEQGLVDISPYGFYKPERETFAYFSEPYRQERVSFAMLASHKGQFEFTSYDSLADLKFRGGTDKHAWYGEGFSDYLSGSEQWLHVHGTDKRIQLLYKGRLDIIVGDPASFEFVNESNQVKEDQQLYVHPFDIYSQDVHFLLSKNNLSESFVAQFNASLKAHPNTR